MTSVHTRARSDPWSFDEVKWQVYPKLHYLATKEFQLEAKAQNLHSPTAIQDNHDARIRELGRAKTRSFDKADRKKGEWGGLKACIACRSWGVCAGSHDTGLGHSPTNGLQNPDEVGDGEKQRERLLASLGTRLEAEESLNETLVSMATGTSVRYGDTVQFRHVVSGCFLKVCPSQQAGMCLDVREGRGWGESGRVWCTSSVQVHVDTYIHTHRRTVTEPMNMKVELSTTANDDAHFLMNSNKVQD